MSQATSIASTSGRCTAVLEFAAHASGYANQENVKYNNRFLFHHRTDLLLLMV